MNKFKEKEMKKKRPINNTWYDWLINYITEATRKTVGCIKNKIVNVFKTITPIDYNKNAVYGRGKKPSKTKNII